MKKITLTIAALLTLSFMNSCSDTTTDLGVHEEEHAEIQEFIDDVENEHFGGTVFDTVTPGAADSLAKEVNTVGTVYLLQIGSSNEGWLSFTHTDTANHDRTIFTDKPVEVAVRGSGIPVPAEESVDLSEFTTSAVSTMAVYHLEPNSEYLIRLFDLSDESVRLFVAPRGIHEDGEGHDH